MKRKNRLWTFMLAIMMIVGMTPNIAYATKWAPIETPPEFTEVVYQNSGSNTDGLSGNFWTVDDSTKGKSLAMGKATWTTQLFFINNTGDAASNAKKTIGDDNRFMISFDICAMQTTSYIVLWLHDSNGNSLVPFVMTGFGKMSFYDSGQPAATYENENSISYEAKKWYNIKILIDTERVVGDYYVDNQYWGRCDFISPYSFNSRFDKDITVGQMFFNYVGQNAVSNGAVTGNDASGEFRINNLKYGMTESREAAEVSLIQDQAGNIYDENAVDISCNIANRTGENQAYTLSYDIRTDTNKRVAYGSEKYDVKNGETRKITLLDKAKEKGFYTAKVYLTNSKGEQVSKDEMRFSVVMHQDDVNSRLGVCVHSTGHGYTYGTPPETMEVTEKLGFSFLRDDYGASLIYDNTWTKLKNFESLNRWIQKDLIKDSKLDLIAILGKGALTTYAYPPQTMDDLKPEALTAWGNYANAMTEWLKDSTGNIEVINEYWISQQKGEAAITNAKSYSEYLKESYGQIKAANPNANVIAICGSASLVPWMENVLKNLGDNPKQYFDTISVHDYMLSYGGSCPEDGLSDSIVQLTDMLKKYGIEKDQIWNTEYGQTSGYTKRTVDEKLKADFGIRQTFLQDPYYAKSTVYQLVSNLGSNNAYEDGFGIVRKAAVGDVWLEALPTAIEFAAYNALFNNAEYISKQIIEDDSEGVSADDVYCYKYKLANGKECFAVWSIESEKDVSVKLGTDSVTMYDAYGNDTKLNAYNGYTTFKISAAPTYFVADKLADSIELRDTPLFSTASEVKTARDDEFVFNVTKAVSDNVSVKAETGINTELNEISEFKDNKSTVKVTTYSDTNEVSEYKFYGGENIEQTDVTITDGGTKTYYKNPVRIKYVASLQSDLKIMPYRSGRWQAILSLKNNKRTSPLSGKIEISTGDSDEINNLLSGEESKFRFNIPEGILKDNYSVETKVRLSDGSIITDSASTNFVSVEKADAPPTIDGKIDSGEWKTSGGNASMKQKSQWASLAAGAEWKGVDDLSADLYLMYDDKYFYLAADVTDDIHCGDDEQNRLWAMDCLQFAVAPEKSSSSAYTEIGIALTKDGNSEIARYHHINQNTPFFSESDMNKFEDTDVKIMRDEQKHKTVYELKIPWTELLTNGKPTADNLIFSAALNENDGKGRVSYMHWADGIANGKNPERYGEIPFN